MVKTLSALFSPLPRSTLHLVMSNYLIARYMSHLSLLILMMDLPANILL
jgi:hypothetical protein